MQLRGVQPFAGVLHQQILSFLVGEELQQEPVINKFD